MSTGKDLLSSLRTLGSKPAPSKEHAEPRPRSWDESTVETLIFGPKDTDSPYSQAEARQSSGTKRAFTAKGDFETASRAWNESEVETLLLAGREPAAPDFQLVAGRSTDSTGVLSSNGSLGPLDGAERAPDLETGLMVPMRKPLVLRLPTEGAKLSYEGTLLSLGEQALVCQAELPSLDPGTEVVATLRVPQWLIVPRRLELPATFESREGSNCTLRFGPFEAKVQKRFDAYVRRAFEARKKRRSARGEASSVAEAFRMVQVALEPFPSGRSRVLLVTSSVSGEGKTFLASGLAIVLAREGRKVLLVDADLYRPTLHEAFGLDAVKGVARLLAAGDSGESLEELVQEPRPGLSVLTGGREGIPSELYVESSVSTLLSHLRGSGFDLVILDAPPLLQTAGVIPLARAADDVLLAVRSGRSRERDLLRSRALLERNGVQLRGAILNGDPGLDETTYGANR